MSSAEDLAVSFWVDRHGHEFIRVVEAGDWAGCSSIAHHRLIAYAHGELEQVFNPALEVDHLNSIPWLNYAENLEAVEKSEHTSRTNRRRARRRVMADGGREQAEVAEWSG